MENPFQRLREILEFHGDCDDGQHWDHEADGKDALEQITNLIGNAATRLDWIVENYPSVFHGQSNAAFRAENEIRVVTEVLRGVVPLEVPVSRPTPSHNGAQDQQEPAS